MMKCLISKSFASLSELQSIRFFSILSKPKPALHNNSFLKFQNRHFANGNDLPSTEEYLEELEYKKFLKKQTPKEFGQKIGPNYIPEHQQPIEWKIPLSSKIMMEKEQWEGYKVPEELEFEVPRRDQSLIKTEHDFEEETKEGSVQLPLEREPQIYFDEDGTEFTYAKGTRKRSRAFAALREGSGVITVNGKCLTEYFKESFLREKIIDPLFITETLGRYDVDVKVSGGGFTGQSEAIVLAISRALQKFDPSWRNTLKEAGHLRRDPREVERKKPGQPKARKKFQWVKR